MQPFNNLMQVVTLTGAQLKTVLEQQFTGGPNNQAFDKILQPSANFTYTYDTSAPWGSKISDMKIDGVPVTDTQPIRVAANNFLVGGGDAFLAFTEGTDLWSGPLDIDAFVAYLAANPRSRPRPPTASPSSRNHRRPHRHHVAERGGSPDLPVSLPYVFCANFLLREFLCT